MKFLPYLTFVLSQLLIFNGSSQTYNEIKKIIASDDASDDRHGFSVDIQGDYVVVGAHKDDDNGINSGSVYIYYKDQGGTDNWGEVKKITASDGAAYDEFGFDVSIDGDNIAVGAHADDDNGTFTGAVYLFNRNQGGVNNWGQVKKIKASDPGAGKAFGFKVELFQNRLVVGANEHSLPSGGFSYPVGPGAAYVFYQNQGGANNWGQVKKISPSDGVSGDGFGYLDMHGDVLVVASHFKNSYQGAAYIFHRNQGGTDNWGQVRKLIPTVTSSIPTYGLGISVHGDNVAIGSYYESGGGSVYVYSKNQGGINNYGLVKKFRGTGVSSGYWFGVAVALENDILAVSAAGNGSSGGNGRAYIFKQNQGGTNNWGQIQIVTASDGAYQDKFSAALELEGKRLVVGASLNDDGGTNSGSAYIFENCFSTPATSTSSSVNSICRGDSTVLTLSGGSLGTGATWEWYSGSCGGTAVGTGTSITVLPTTNTTYYVRAEGTCNTTTCVSSTINVTQPVVATNNTTSTGICTGETKSLAGTTTGGAWSVVAGGGSITGTTYTPNSSITAVTAVTVRYTLPASGPCPSDFDDVTFNVSPIAAASITNNASNMCVSDTKGLQGTPAGGSWSVISGPGSITGTQLTANAPGTIQIQYKIGAGSCADSISQSIRVIAGGIAAANNDNLTVSTGGTGSVNITANDTGDVSTISILTQANSGVGTVTGGAISYQSNVGFLGADSIEYIICDAICGNVCDSAWVYLTVEDALLIPEFISPNGDGINDEWAIKGLSRFPNASAKIFNRWGKLLYEAAPYPNDWDGSNIGGVSGKENTSGTYFYILELGDNSEPKTGYVQIRK